MSDPRVLLLFQKWKQLRDSGVSITPAEICCDQPDLIAKLESLIEEQERLESLASPPVYGLDSPPPLDPHATQPPNPKEIHDTTATTPGKKPSDGSDIPLAIGQRGYKILAKLGEGGMGYVFQAIDPLFNRVLAIKILKEDHKDQREYEQRFLEEAQLLGQLQHPGVPPIHDLGFLPDRRPFFAMKLIKGRTLARLLEARPSLEHDLARFLDIFEQICQTMANAHAHKVIHRDLKPSNVMVGAFGEVQVMDWGLAKVLKPPDEEKENSEESYSEKSIIATVRSEILGDSTQAGGVIGTPAFMPPEFALGQVEKHDERSDVFLLGGILSVILTGRPPYETKKRLIPQQHADLQPAIDKIRTSGVDSELIDLALSCLAPQRESRPAHAGIVADRVAAYRAAVRERTRQAELKEAEAHIKAKEERRRRLWQAALGSLATVAILAGAGVWFQYKGEKAARATAEAQTEADNERKARIAEQQAKETEAALRKDAEDALKEVEKQRLRAEANFAKAQAAVDDYLTKVSETQLLQVPGMQLLRRELLQSALTFYQGFLKERGDDPTIRAGLAAAYLRIGRIHEELQSIAEGHKAYEEAAKIYEALVKENPNNLDLKAGLTKSQFELGNLPKAITLGMELVDAGPAKRSYKQLLANVYHTYAMRFPPHSEQGLEANRKALALREVLVQEDPDDPEAQQGLAGSLNNIANAVYFQGRLEDALNLYRLSHDHHQRALQKAPNNLGYGKNTINICVNLGRVLRQLRRDEEALVYCQRAVDTCLRLAEQNPTIASLPGVALANSYTLADVQKALGKKDAAAMTIRQGHAVLERLPKDGPFNLYNIACSRARCASLLNERLKELTAEEKQEMDLEANLAMDALKKAVESGWLGLDWMKKDEDLVLLHSRSDYKELVDSLEVKVKAANLARTSPQLSLPDQLKGNQEVLTLREKLATADPGNRRLQLDLAASKKAIALIYSTQGKLEEALAILSQAKATCESLLKADPKIVGLPTELASIFAGLADVHAKSNHKSEAMESWRGCIDVLNSVNAARPGDPEVKNSLIAAHNGLYTAYYMEGLWREAAVHLKKQVELDPEFHWKAYSLAPLLVLNGEKDAYLEHRRIMLARFGKTAVPEIAERIARASLLLPIDQTELSRLSAMVDMNLTDPKVWQYPFGLVAKALTEVRQGNCKGALERIALVLSLHPGWSIELPAHYLAALAHKGLKQNLEAQEALDWADWQFNNLKASANDEKFDITIWIICHLLRREAHECVDGKPLPPDPSEYISRSRAYMRLGEKAKAESEVDQATVIAPTNPAVWLARGQILQQLGKQDQAQASFAKAAELESKDPPPWIEQGRFLAERGDHLKADEAFSRAAKLTPNELNRFFDAGWWVVGPYPQDLVLPCPPEKDPDPAKPVAAASGPKELTWITAPVRDLGLVELWRIIQGTPLSAYALNYVYSPDERTATLNVGADFGIRVWLNGRLILDNPAMWPDHAAPWSVIPVPVVLRSGRNTILVKVSKLAAGHAFQMRLSDGAYDRALAAAKFGLWDDAAQPTVQYFRRQPLPISDFWVVRIWCLQAAGKSEEAARWSARFFQMTGNTNDPIDAFRVTSVCQVPAESPDLAHLREALEKWFPAGESIHWQHYCAGVGLYRLNQLEQALKHLRRCQELDPKWSVSWPTMLALTLERTGNHEEALEWLGKAEDWYDKTTKEGLKDGMFVLPFGYAFWDLAQFQIQLREAQALIRKSPPPEDQTRKALQTRAREVIGGFDPSTFAFDMAIQLDPFQPRLWLARARRHAELKHDKQAVADFAKAVELAPKDINVWKLRGRTYAELSQFDNSAADYLKALTLLPANLPFWDSQIQALGQEIAVWEEVFDRVIKERPKDTGLWMARRSYLVQGGKWQEASKAANRLIEVAPDDSVFWMGACMLHAQVGDLVAYRKLTADMLARFASADHAAHRERALKMAFLMPDAVSDFPALLKTADSLKVDAGTANYLWYFNLAKSAIYYRAGRYDQAERLFQDVSINSAPGSYFKAEALLFLAMTQHKLGKKDEARKNLVAARTLVNNDLPLLDRGQPILGGDFHDRLRSPILLREAEALIEGKTPKVD